MSTAKRERKRQLIRIHRLNSKIHWVRKKGGHCHFCGYFKNLAALDFHHINPEIKTKDPSRILGRRDQNELEECVLVCKICHGRIHASTNGNKCTTGRYIRLLDILGYRCRNCGLELNAKDRDFDLHHPPGAKKTGKPAALLRSYRKNKEELECLFPLCKNCHAEEHNPHLFIGETLDKYRKELEEKIVCLPEVSRLPIEKVEFLRAVDKCKTRKELTEYLGLGESTVNRKIKVWGVTKYLTYTRFQQHNRLREMLDEGYTRKEILKELNITPRTFYRWKERGNTS